MTENEISKIVVDIAYRIHINLGPGLLESVYESIFAYELKKSNLDYLQQIEIPVMYDGIIFNNSLRIDLLIANKVIVELKSVEQVLPVHKKQLLTYLKLSDKRLGLLINFNESHIKHGITRVVNDLEE
jgi:GxxExxY protein